jgi:hypothetical protein
MAESGRTRENDGTRPIADTESAPVPNGPGLQAYLMVKVKERSAVAAGFEQEPDALLRFIDPVLQQARASEVTVSVA